MTETPESDKEEFRADDLPDPVIEQNEDGSLPYMSQELRAARWTVAKTRAAEKGTDPRTEFNDMLLERKKATMGPNPTQEKARKLYEWWFSGCGTKSIDTYGKYDHLNIGEKEQWVMLAKALGDHPYHDHTPDSVTRKAEKYKNIPVGLSWAEYDNALHPEDAGYSGKLDGVSANSYIHDDDPTYEEWVEAQPLQRKYWWQFWRPTEVFTDYDHYTRFVRDQARYRKAAIELGFTTSSAH